ncbi:amino acid ABC transporter permease [Paenibacillus sp. FSL M7-1455]|jgi:putative glutamine transport system permease protein|uniref:Glutamine ABC transporter permease protein GlnM n=1 Tax=Paenibacillus cookii TaxID=157839 RepID=A0ABQ4LTM6_9BACL|nr:amino acid ABC transporter permease [Paenibacillus cookii]GIO66620.1 putative glutamine ABC transporter permease protein GlnM [Paenibacillus cookii]
MEGKFDIHILFDHWDRFSAGFLHTIGSSALALVGSFILGTIIAVMRIAPLKPLNWIGTAYVEFIRNIPLLLVVFVFFLGLPTLGVPLDGFTSGTLGLMVYTASFIAEAIRAGIQSVPSGQSEAARATGLSYMQTMVHIILPQAIKIVLPSISNQFINLVKNSSILAVVSGFDLMYYADLINADTFLPLTVYTIVALFYLILTLPLSMAVHYMERRFRAADR